jgi:hypothetical protein
VGIGAKQYPEELDARMIAPCGMDCGLCMAHLRDRKPCDGCHGPDAVKPNHCVVCAIKNCESIDGASGGFCYQCERFPCLRLRQLDKRYREKYGMSMIENLGRIRDDGIDAFVATERARWRCAGCRGVVCVHDAACVYCGEPREQR